MADSEFGYTSEMAEAAERARRTDPLLAHPPRKRPTHIERPVTDRQTGETKIVKEAVPDRVKPAADLALMDHYLQGQPLAAPDDFSEDECERFWQLVRRHKQMVGEAGNRGR